MPVTDFVSTLALIEQGATTEAIARLEPLVAAWPTYLAGHAALARAFEAEGRWADALAAWQRVRLLMPQSPAAAEGLSRTVAALTVATASGPAAPAAPPNAWADAGMLEPPRLDDEPGAEDIGDLDRLIEELETARIFPDPFPESIPTPNLDDDIDDMVSETLARIYETQNQYEEAARVYEKLAAQHPDRADDYLDRAHHLRHSPRK